MKQNKLFVHFLLNAFKINDNISKYYCSMTKSLFDIGFPIPSFEDIFRLQSRRQSLRGEGGNP